jgi:antitoxin HicB
MADARLYEVVLCPEDDGGYSVVVPELPSVATQGKTREEALRVAKEAIEGYLEVMREDGLSVPRIERDHVSVGA